MKKFLTALLIGVLMAGSIFAFNANAPRAYQSSTETAPMYQSYLGMAGGYMFSEEDMITVTGVIESIEENEEYPGMLEIIVKTDDGEEVELHANAYFAEDLEVGKTIEVTGWSVEINEEKIFKAAEAKVDGEETLLNGYRGSARGTGYMSETHQVPMNYGKKANVWNNQQAYNNYGPQMHRMPGGRGR